MLYDIGMVGRQQEMPIVLQDVVEFAGGRDHGEAVEKHQGADKKSTLCSSST